MKKTFLSLLLLSCFITLGQAPGWLQTADGKIPAVDANPKNLNIYENFIKAHNKRNLKKIAKMTHDEIVIEMPDGGKIEGKEAYINLLSDWFSSSNPIWSSYFAYSMKVKGQEGEWVIAGHALKDDGQNLNVWDLVDIYILDKKVRRVIVYRKEIES